MPRPRVYRRPNEQVMFETAEVARCPRCMWIWEASAMVKEDGIDKCPNCADITATNTYKAAKEAEEANRNAEMIARFAEPQISQVSLNDPVVAIVRRITNSAGSRVYESSPLDLVSGGPAMTLLLLGHNFTAADTASASIGITVAVTARTATQTDLSITAAGGITAGGYHLVFNSVYYRNIFRVR